MSKQKPRFDINRIAEQRRATGRSQHEFRNCIGITDSGGSRYKCDLASIVSFALLASCGGSGGSSASSTTTTSPVPNCPSGYSSVVLERTSLPSATISLTAENATFSFKAPTTNIEHLPSIKICFGVSTSPLEENGLITLSNTYEIKTYDLSHDPIYPATLLHYLDRTLAVNFDTNAVPNGTSTVDMANNIHVFNSSATPLAETVQRSITIRSSPHMSTIEAYPGDEGRYVVAYRP